MATGTGYAVLHSFTGTWSDGASPQFSGLAAKNSVLYGMTQLGGEYNYGTVFKINPAGTDFAVLHSFGGNAADGRSPMGDLTVAGTKICGMTYGGGSSDNGVLFKINTTGTAFQILHEFAGIGDGARPLGSLVRKATVYSEVLYGFTQNGGAFGYGAIFSYKLR